MEEFNAMETQKELLKELKELNENLKRLQPVIYPVYIPHNPPVTNPNIFPMYPTVTWYSNYQGKGSAS